MVPGETDEQRQQKAEVLAERRGREKAEIDAQFIADKRRLDAINHSIEKTGDALLTLDKRVDDLAIMVATMRTKLGFYAALGSLAGGGVVALVVGLATKVGGG
jgi:hypothetical protein